MYQSGADAQAAHQLYKGAQHGMFPQGLYHHGLHAGSKEDHSEGGLTSEEDLHRHSGGSLLHCCLCCCGVAMLMFMLVPFGVGIYFNHNATWLIQTTGSDLLGVNVTVEDVSLHALQGDVSMTSLTIANPLSYPGAFASMDASSFDLSLWALVKSHLPFGSKVFHIKNMSVQNCHVAVKMQSPLDTSTSNAEEILDHLNNVTAHIDQDLHKQQTNKTIAQKLEVNVEVGYFAMRNVSASLEVHPMPAVSFTVNSVVVTNIGTATGGVPLYQFMEIVARTLLESVIEGAPKEAATKLAGAMGVNVSKTLDYGKAKVDKVADGLGGVDLGNFTSWAAQMAEPMLGNETQHIESDVEEGFMGTAQKTMDKMEDKFKHMLGLD